MLKKGILIYAIGHPQYGKYAFNLAVTIKAVEDVHIAIVCDRSAVSHLDTEQLSLFSHIIPSTQKPGCSVKLNAYQDTPFDHTIVLDADMLWLPERKPSDLFAEVEGFPYTAISEGSTDDPSAAYFFWGSVEEIREKYKVGKIHQWRTEVTYFEKGAVAKKLFKDAQKIYANHGLSWVKEFAGGVPDELAINIATALSEIEPHAPKWQPSYWPSMHGHRVPEPATLYRNYYLLSVGGNVTLDPVKLVYNRIVKAQAPKIGLQHCFPLQSKHTFLPERKRS